MENGAKVSCINVNEKNDCDFQAGTGEIKTSTLERNDVYDDVTETI